MGVMGVIKILITYFTTHGWFGKEQRKYQNIIIKFSLKENVGLKSWHYFYILK